MKKELGGFFGPRRTALYHSVGVDQELSGAGDERCIMDFAVCDEASIEGDESLVPSLRGCLSGGEQGLSDP